MKTHVEASGHIINSQVASTATLSPSYKTDYTMLDKIMQASINTVIVCHDKNTFSPPKGIMSVPASAARGNSHKLTGNSRHQQQPQWHFQGRAGDQLGRLCPVKREAGRPFQPALGQLGLASWDTDRMKITLS